MIPDSDSLFVKNFTELYDFMFNTFRDWIIHGQDLKKKEIIEVMRKIQGRANWIESKTKDAGYSYFGVDKP